MLINRRGEFARFDTPAVKELVKELLEGGQEAFDFRKQKYGFASEANTTCATFFTKEDDGLTQDWKNHRVLALLQPTSRTHRNKLRAPHDRAL
ncbi:hypothetical protein V1282_003989 [Nitrobacteraceae bacterium AZCC 2146]